MPSSAAICWAGLSPERHSSTALRLKFSSYRLYLRGTGFPVFMLLGAFSSHSHPTLTHQIEARPYAAA